MGGGCRGVVPSVLVPSGGVPGRVGSGSGTLLEPRRRRRLRHQVHRQKPLGRFKIFRERRNNAFALRNGRLQPPHPLNTVTFVLLLRPFGVLIAFAGLASRTKPALRGTLEICLEQLRTGGHTPYHSP